MKYSRCEKCDRFGFNRRAIDEEMVADPHCVLCGYRPTRDPTAEEYERATPGLGAKQRKRNPSHGKMSL